MERIINGEDSITTNIKLNTAIGQIEEIFKKNKDLEKRIIELENK